MLSGRGASESKGGFGRCSSRLWRDAVALLCLKTRRQVVDQSELYFGVGKARDVRLKLAGHVAASRARLQEESEGTVCL